jgi:DNA-binding PadR family transcriptional regulator
MSLKHGLLGLLNYGSMTGYELHKVFQNSLNFFWQAQVSQIYRELNAMEKKGWLTSEYEMQTDKPNKKRYTITKSGRQELKNWLNHGRLEDAMTIRSAFMMEIFFSGERSTRENLEQLKTFADLCEKSLVRMDEADASVSNYEKVTKESDRVLYWMLTASFGRRYFEMCLRWAKDAIQILEEE